MLMIDQSLKLSVSKDQKKSILQGGLFQLNEMISVTTVTVTRYISVSSIFLIISSCRTQEHNR